MTPLQSLVSQPWAHTLGWTLLHFIWQRKRKCFQIADDLMHVFHHTGDGLMLVHNAVNPKGPHR